MTTQINVDLYAGALVFWRAGMSAKAALEAASTEAGVKAYWYEIQPQKALELALGDQYHRTGKLIRHCKPVEAKNKETGAAELWPAMVVVDEQVGERNDYQCGERYFLDPASYIVYNAADGLVADNIRATDYLGQVSAARVGLGLEQVVREVGGYKLRDNARVYYLPQSKMTDWQRVCSAFESLGASFYQANCPADADTAAAVADNAATELRDRYQAALDAIYACDQTLSSSEANKASRTKAVNRREEMLAELEQIKLEASQIDASFRGLLDLSSQIGGEIDTAMAMAVLTTAAG